MKSLMLDVIICLLLVELVEDLAQALVEGGTLVNHVGNLVVGVDGHVQLLVELVLGGVVLN